MVIPEVNIDADTTFEDVVKPLMRWMAENQHPHTTIILTCNRAELVEGMECYLNDDFIVD